jgi:hypothetical protein
MGIDIPQERFFLFPAHIRINPYVDSDTRKACSNRVVFAHQDVCIQFTFHMHFNFSHGQPALPGDDMPDGHNTSG